MQGSQQNEKLSLRKPKYYLQFYVPLNSSDWWTDFTLSKNLSIHTTYTIFDKKKYKV